MPKLNYDPFRIAEAHLELWNHRNLAPIKALLAPTATTRFTWEPAERPALQAIEETLALWHTAFPEIHFTHTNIIGAPGNLTIEYTATATHKGAFLNIPPTGRHGTVRGATALRINEDGKIYRETIYVDLTAILGSIGMLPAPLAEEKLRVLALEYIDATNRHDLNKCMALMTMDATLTVGAPLNVREAQELLLRNFTAMPDIKITVNQMTVRGNQVVLEGSLSGTLQAPFGAIPATGRAVKLDDCMIFTFRGDKIVHIDQYVDNYSLRVQAGVIPEFART